VGGTAVLFLLAPVDDRDLAVSSRLGADCLWDFFLDRDRNDVDCWVSLNNGNRQSAGPEEWYSRRVGNRRTTAGRRATSDGASIELSASRRQPLVVEALEKANRTSSRSGELIASELSVRALWRTNLVEKAGKTIKQATVLPSL